MDEKKVDSPYNNEYLISGLEEIYNELKAAKPNSRFVTKDLSNLSKSKKQYELEEFLVESLTNFELIKELNEVSAENVILPTKKKSLLSKLLDRILNWLRDFLGKDFNVNKDSLLAKEFEIFESVINETPDNTTNREEPMDSSTGDVIEPTEPDTIIPDNNAINNVDIDSIDLSGMFSTVAVSNQDNISSEMQVIKERSIADGTFMKAPNGNPTNLTERQWLQVRTKNFINWFGDWINDPANASKVVDENGEPLVVYHGSKSIFHTFKNKYETHKEEKYLETSEIKKEVLDTFTDKEKNILIPLINKFENNPFIALSEFTKSEEELFNKYSKQLNILENSRKKVIQHYNIGDFFTTDKTYAETYGTNIYSVFLNIRNPKYSDKLHRIYTSDSRINSLQEEGYDGDIGNDVKGRDIESKGKEYLVFNSNQIKSAIDNIGAFSSTNNNIRFSSLSVSNSTPSATAPSIRSFMANLDASTYDDIQEKLNNGVISITCK